MFLRVSVGRSERNDTRFNNHELKKVKNVIIKLANSFVAHNKHAFTPCANRRVQSEPSIVFARAVLEKK